ncbi:MAG: energy-coupling factor transport system substrate-specific component [Patescibacteria group bacterium]|nr:energy-coupling factor transport system substrate-specific component [Patescibacteria group bacterium]MDQ5922745.1 energy-coupling factor transport system substrate-specific component [Patescibacteria group bacterium]
MLNNIKILIVFVGCLLFRLLPLRAPNLEPIMASIMPISKKYALFTTFIFASSSMVLYDFITGYVGLWTWTTAVTYGLVGVGAYFFFRIHKGTVYNFVIFSFIGTIVFDVITGVLFAPLFGVSMFDALMLQIPFTLIHLLGNIGFAVTVAPLLNKWFTSPKLFSFKKSYSSALGGIKA